MLMIWALADRLHMTVDDLMDRMKVTEFRGWVAYVELMKQRGK